MEEVRVAEEILLEGGGLQIGRRALNMTMVEAGIIFLFLSLLKGIKNQGLGLPNLVLQKRFKAGVSFVSLWMECAMLIRELGFCLMPTINGVIRWMGVFFIVFGR